MSKKEMVDQLRKLAEDARHDDMRVLLPDPIRSGKRNVGEMLQYIADMLEE